MERLWSAVCISVVLGAFGCGGGTKTATVTVKEPSDVRTGDYSGNGTVTLAPTSYPAGADVQWSCPECSIFFLIALRGPVANPQLIVSQDSSLAGSYLESFDQRRQIGGRIVKRKVLYGFAALVAFGILVTACGGDGDGSAGEQTTTEERTTTEAATTAPAEKPKPSEDCKRVPAALVAAIQEGITVRGVKLRNAYCVRSNV